MATGMSCYHHPSKQAVATCRSCGKGICADCYEVYGVNTGEYAGKALCYDCSKALVAENVEIVKSIKSATVTQLVLLPFTMIWNILKGIFYFFECCSALASGKGIFYFFKAWGFIFKVVWAPIKTIIDISRGFSNVKRANAIIASDTQALAEMADYFAYTQMMEEKQGFDLATLTSEGGELFNNTYAQSVLKNGEKGAQAQLRESVVQISANGEIIRSFKPQKKDKAS